MPCMDVGAPACLASWHSRAKHSLGAPNCEFTCHASMPPHPYPPSIQGPQGAPSLSRASDGARFQYLWRYRAATDKWDVVHQVKSTVVPQSNPRGDDWTQTMASISASSGSALYASWSGEEGAAT